MRQEHWENVYKTKSPQQVSWTQEKPNTSLKLIAALNLKPADAIIDVGGGDSNLVDHLLGLGFKDITVLDISKQALIRAQERLGDRASRVQWICCDITQFKPSRTYALWHDRAAFHFLTTPKSIEAYLALTRKFVKDFLVLGTFSKDGPAKCSGLEITQYDPQDIASTFAPDFQMVSSKKEVHITPFDTQQNFTFCSLKRTTAL